MSLISMGRTLLTGVAQLVYPNTCWTCANFMVSDQKGVCADCFARLAVDPFPTCPRCSNTVGPHLVLDAGCPACANESFGFDSAFRMAPYEGLLREVILRMKHASGEDLAEVIGALWAKTMRERLNPLGAGVVIPVPLHWSRSWRRGFNQAAILARCLASELRLPVRSGALRRIRATPHQTEQRSGQARRENVHRAFQAASTLNLDGATVLLVDDVLTTGATASEAARALRRADAGAIHVVVLAHGR